MVDNPQSANPDSENDASGDHDDAAEESPGSGDSGSGTSEPSSPFGESRTGDASDPAGDEGPFGGGGPFEERMSSEGGPFADGGGSGAPGSASEGEFGDLASEFEGSGFDPSDAGGDSGAGFAYEMAKMWVQDNQKTVMLGAFATGVFLGALLRD
jgi:hypothetical protein